MREVLGRAARAPLIFMRELGVSTEGVLAGLPFDEHDLGRPAFRIDWDDYAELADRVTERCGGLRQAEIVCERAYPSAASALFPILGLLVSPLQLFRLIDRSVMPMAYANLTVEDADLPGARRVVRFALRPMDRPCLAFFHATLGCMRAAPRILGLPNAQVDATIAGHSATYMVTLPRSQTLPARLQRRSAERVASIAAEELEASWLDTRRRHDDFVAAAATLDERVARAASAWRLTAKQAAVLRHLARGRSAKEIAAEIGCAVHTVELHTSAILKRAGIDSRAALVAAVWDGAASMRAAAG